MNLVKRILTPTALLVFLVLSLQINAQERKVEGQHNLNTEADFSLSPYTGYTRAHWLEITEKIIAGVLPYFDKETGMPELARTLREKVFNEVRVPNAEEKRRALERIMMAVVIYTTATGKDEIPDYKGSISAPFIRAVTKGTDPGDEAYWGDPEPTDQVGSVFALAVYLNPALYWYPLSQKQKNNLLKFLEKHSKNKAFDNNHHFFHMAPVALLEANGYDSNREHLDQMFEKLLGWYRGDGWYIDGNNQGFDKYNLWGFQLYMQALIRFDEKWKTRYKATIDRLTARFFETLPYMYGRDGSPIPWGRSLCYRFAGLSAIGWAELNGNCTLPPGEARRIASGELKYFWEHGCLGENGVLNIGYWGKNAAVAESYINVGDPYWAMHGLACLLVPEDDPYWTAKEEAIPADGAGGKLTVKGAQMNIRVSPVDGEARLFPVGQPFKHGRDIWQTGLKYDQEAYSSYLGFCLTGENGDDPGAGRTGYSLNGDKWYFRESAKYIFSSEDHLVSSYVLKPEPSYEITTHTLVGNEGEIYVFMHNYPEPIYLYKGGYNICSCKYENVKTIKTEKTITTETENYFSTISLFSSVVGKLETKYLQQEGGWAHNHLFGGNGVFPYWKSSSPVPPNIPVIIYANGTRKREPFTPDIKVISNPGELRIRFEGKWYEIKFNY